MPDPTGSVTPPPDTAAPPPPEPQISLAEHEAQFSPDPEVRDEAPEPETPAPPAPEQTAEAKPDRRDARGRYRGKDLATPADVPRIQTLSRELKEAREELDRIKAQIAKPAPREEPKAPPAFTDKEPTLEQFASEPDPYLALARAQAAYDRRKDAADAQTTQHTEAAKAAEQERIARIDGFFTEKHTAHLARMQAYITNNPDARGDFDAAGNETITPVMAAAIALMDDDSAKALHAVVKHQDLRDELVLQTLEKEITPPLVAIVQRRLKARMEAGVTGSASPAHRPVMVPRPPNPVRTAPQTPAGSPPGEGASLAEHERYWGPKRPH